MITFPESMSPRISRENGRADHPLSGRKVPEYEVRDIRWRPPRPPRMKFRRMDFSRAECFDTTATGKSTSARSLHSLGIICCYLIHYPINSALPDCHPSVFCHRAFWPRPRHSTSFFAFRFFRTRRIMSALTLGQLT